MTAVWPGPRSLVGQRGTVADGLEGVFGPAVVASAGASAAYPTANLAIYYPFVIAEPTIITALAVRNGATASGNLDLGIYSDDGTRIVSTGTTAQSGTSTWQVVDITDTLIDTGCFYLAIACDATTLTFIARTTLSVGGFRAIGLVQEATAFPLPATATFAAFANAYCPNLAAVCSPRGTLL